MSPRTRTALVGLTALTLLGCGPVRGDVSGTVSSQGKLVKSGTVTFFGADGPAHGVIDRSGRYSVKEVVAGRGLKVVVVNPHPSENVVTTRDGKKGVADPEALQAWFAIPDDYADPLRTPLRYDVRPGSNQIDIELKDLR